MSVPPGFLSARVFAGVFRVHVRLSPLLFLLLAAGGTHCLLEFEVRLRVVHLAAPVFEVGVIGFAKHDCGGFEPRG